MAWRDPFDIQLPGQATQAAGLAPADKPSLGTGFLDNLRATRQEMELVGNTNAGSERLRGDYAPLVAALEEAGESFGAVSLGGASGRAHFLNPFDLPEAAGVGGTASRDQMRAEIFSRIRARRKADPKFLAGVPDTFEAFEQQSADKAAAKLQEIRRVQSGATGLGQLGGFLGGVIGSGEDPVNVWTMPFGGASKTIVGAFARSAAENMLVETLSQPFIAENYAELGEHLTIGDSVRQVLFAGAAGGAFGGGTKAIGKGLAAAGPAYDRFVGRVFDSLPEPLREQWASGATVGDRTLAETIRATVPEDRWTPEQRDAVNIIERDAEIREASPFVASPDGDQAHADSLMAALQAGIDARPGPSGRGALLGSTALVNPPAATAGRAMGRDELIRFVMHRLEGGDQVVHYSQVDGGVTKFGIAAKFNPGVDVAKLTEAQAFEIAKRDYWFPELDRAPAPAAAVAFDAGFISGPKVGKRILAASGGDAERAIALYRAHLNHIADNVPGKAKYRDGWNNRVDALARELGLAGNGRAEPMAGLADLGEARASAELEAELAARDLDEAAVRSARLGPDEDAPLYRPVPELKRDLFASDEQWIDAQMELGRSLDRQTSPGSAGNGPTARETAVGPAEVAEGAPDAAREAEGFTVQSYVEAYMRGEGRGDSPRDRELRQFAANEGPAIEAEFARRRAVASSAPLSREELDAISLRQTGETPDALWYAGYNNVTARELGREPEPLWAVRDKRTGQVVTWSVKKTAARKALADLWEPEQHEVFELTPDMIAGSLRRRLADSRAEVRLDNPALERFTDPDSDGVRAQVESLEHDLRAAIDKDPEFGERLFATAEDDKPRTLLTILDELDAEDAAVVAMKACL